MNVLNIKLNSTVGYNLRLDNSQFNSIQGLITCICNQRFEGMTQADIWSRIREINDVNDSIIYIITATRGRDQITYVGKTLNTLHRRYPNGPTGGLKLVFDLYNKGGAMLDCVLYNASHPALVELWCYQILVDKGINLANRQDPS